MRQAGFCSSYFLQRHSGKLKSGKYSLSGKRLHHRGLAHSLSEVMFNASSAAFACKGPQARKPLQWCEQDTF